MATKIDIINMALLNSGCRTIISLSENSEESKAAALHYDTVRDSVLADIPWSFCVTEAILTAITPPLAGHSFSYALPHDYLKLINVFIDGNPKTLIEAGRYVIVSGPVMAVCTDISGKYIARYIQRITDDELFSADFVEALSYKLASKLALAIGRDSAGSFNLLQVYGSLINVASGSHIQQNSPQPTHGSSYVSARSGYGGQHSGPGQQR